MLAPFRTLIDLYLRSILATITDRDIKYFAGGSQVYLEKITFSSHGGQNAL